MARGGDYSLGLRRGRGERGESLQGKFPQQALELTSRTLGRHRTNSWPVRLKGSVIRLRKGSSGCSTRNKKGRKNRVETRLSSDVMKKTPEKTDCSPGTDTKI